MSPQFKSAYKEVFPAGTEVEYQSVWPWEIDLEVDLKASGRLRLLSQVVTIYPSFSSIIFADTDGTASAATIMNKIANQFSFMVSQVSVQGTVNYFLCDKIRHVYNRINFGREKINTGT